MPDGFGETPVEDLVKGVCFEVDGGGFFAFAGVDLEEGAFFQFYVTVEGEESAFGIFG